MTDYVCSSCQVNPATEVVIKKGKHGVPQRMRLCTPCKNKRGARVFEKPKPKRHAED